MSSALEELAQMARLQRMERMMSGPPTSEDEARASRAAFALQLEGLVEELESDRTGSVVALRMLSAAEISVDDMVGKVIRNNDVHSAKVLRDLTESVRSALLRAAKKALERCDE